MYHLVWRPRTPLPVPDWDEMHMRVHRGLDAPLGGPWLYNWAIRRDRCVLVSGDLPRLALLRIHPGPVAAPPFHKLGDRAFESVAVSVASVRGHSSKAKRGILVTTHPKSPPLCRVFALCPDKKL